MVKVVGKRGLEKGRMGKGGLAVSGDDPEHMGHKKVGKRAGHHEEQLGVLVVGAPELEGLEEGLAGRDVGGGRSVFDHGVGDRVLFVVAGASGFGDSLGPRFAVVERFFDDEEGQDKQSAAEGKLDVEEKAPGVAAGQHVAGVKWAGGAEAEADWVSLAKLRRKTA
jgi:hypothetical protein